MKFERINNEYVLIGCLSSYTQTAINYCHQNCTVKCMFARHYGFHTESNQAQLLKTGVVLALFWENEDCIISV